MSINEQIKRAQKRVRFLKRKKPLEIGKYVLDNYKVPMTDKNGDVITAKDGKNRMRKLHDVNEFKKDFTILLKSSLTNSNKSNDDKHPKAPKSLKDTVPKGKSARNANNSYTPPF